MCSCCLRPLPGVGDAGGPSGQAPPDLGATITHSHGAVAQLAERLHGMQEVGGSNPPSSTETAGFFLGGLVAGEGCFCITRSLPHYADGAVRPRFIFDLEMARRDEALVLQLHRFLGVGSIGHRSRPNQLPTVRLRIASIRAHRRALIPFADRYLIAGVKRTQYPQWRAAPEEHLVERPYRWGEGRATCSVDGCVRPVRGQGLCRTHYYRATGH